MRREADRLATRQLFGPLYHAAMAMDAAALYPPPPEFSARAHVNGPAAYAELRRLALADPQAFWSQRARAALHWFRPFDRVLEWKPPFSQWFLGGTTNASFNCLDRHLSGWRRNKAALLWEGENREQRTLTYQQLHRLVCQFAGALQRLGYKQGDRAIIYLPMIPEAAVAMLACARLGIIHSVVFAGFSSEALRTRMEDLEAQLVITADFGRRRGREVPLKANVDAALDEYPGVRHSIVYRHTGSPIVMKPGRDLEWSELMLDAPAEAQPRHGAGAPRQASTSGTRGAAALGPAPVECPAVELPSEHPLYVLYTSGTTGKPKGVVHSTAGYLVQVQATMEWVFDLKEEDVYWCTADIGWVTGHSYIIYGPLAAGATTVMYEGAPDFPAPDRFWEIIAKYRVNLFYTSPTAIRSFIRAGDAHPARHDLSSLRLLGSVGEPIQPAAWEWYRRVIGGGRCPIVDTWWQTETGAILLSPVPGAVATKPGSATLPLPGIAADVVNLAGEPVPDGQQGYLILRKPWPSMLRGLWRDPERYQENYWSRYPGIYFTGDAARRDSDGYYWVLGRVDDVINVSGHRMSTMEVESVMVRHAAVAEAAAVGRPDELKGQALVVYCTLKSGNAPTPALAQELRVWVATEIGAFARPDEVKLVEGLPKTRSGKIMRRLLRELVTSATVQGDVSTLEDYSVLLKLSGEGREEEELLRRPSAP